MEPTATDETLDESVEKFYVLTGVHHPGALPGVQQALQALPGVKCVELNPLTGQLRLVGVPQALDAAMESIVGFAGRLATSSPLERAGSDIWGPVRRKLGWPVVGVLTLLTLLSVIPEIAASILFPGEIFVAILLPVCALLFASLPLVVASDFPQWHREQTWKPHHIDRTIVAFAACGSVAEQSASLWFQALGVLLIRRLVEILLEVIRRDHLSFGMAALHAGAPETTSDPWKNQLQRISMQPYADGLARVGIPAGISAVSVFVLLFVLLLPVLELWTEARFDSVPARLLGFFPPQHAAAVSVALLACLTPGAFALLSWPALFRWSRALSANGTRLKTAAKLQTIWETRLFAWARGGVVTQGQPRIEETLTAAGLSQTEARRLAAQLESGSTHSIARAFAETTVPLPWKERSELADRGVVATTEEHRYAIGSELLMQSLGVDLKPFAHDLYRFSCEGRSAVLLARDEEVLAVFKLSDPLRAESVKTLKSLRAFACRSYLLSGEPEANLRIAGEQIGAEEIRSGITPGSAAAVVSGLKRETIGRVAVIAKPNEATLLASADASIAFGLGETNADVQVPGRSLDEVVSLYKDARALRNRIYLMVAILAVYYLTVIPLAFLGLLPVLAVAVLAGIMELMPLLLCMKKLR